VTFRTRHLATIAAILAPGLALAHDLLLERAGEGLALRHGHRGGELLAIDQPKVKAVRCLAKVATPEADSVVLEASLSFEVAK